MLKIHPFMSGQATWWQFRAAEKPSNEETILTLHMTVWCRITGTVPATFLGDFVALQGKLQPVYRDGTGWIIRRFLRTFHKTVPSRKYVKIQSKICVNSVAVPGIFSPDYRDGTDRIIRHFLDYTLADWSRIIGTVPAELYGDFCGRFIKRYRHGNPSSHRRRSRHKMTWNSAITAAVFFLNRRYLSAG